MPFQKSLKGELKLIPEIKTSNSHSLVAINNVIRGIMLTKEYVPDIREVYARTEGLIYPTKYPLVG